MVSPGWPTRFSSLLFSFCRVAFRSLWAGDEASERGPVIYLAMLAPVLTKGRYADAKPFEFSLLGPLTKVGSVPSTKVGKRSSVAVTTTDGKTKAPSKLDSNGPTLFTCALLGAATGAWSRMFHWHRVRLSKRSLLPGILHVASSSSLLATPQLNTWRPHGVLGLSSASC